MRAWCALTVVALALPLTSHAACEAQHKALDDAKGADVPAAFTALATCDTTEAGQVFAEAMRATGDVESLVALTTAALDAGLVEPVQAMAEQIPASSRTETTTRIGAACSTHAPTLQMLVGLHQAVKDRAYAAWEGGLGACEADALTSMLESAVKAPPPHTFDDKYNTVLAAYAERKGVDALPAMQAAAKASLKGGPLQMIVEAMQRAVTPEGLNAQPSEADRGKLVTALTAVAGDASPEQASAIAGRLVAVGAEDAAVSLLGRIYPDAVQKGGGFVYGVAAVETCDKETVLHWAEVSEPGKRWSVLEAVQGPARAFKARLKCDSGEWEVRLTNGPVAGSDAVEAWAETVAAELGDAKLREEKGLKLD
jgi:hypothetical protein